MLLPGIYFFLSMFKIGGYVVFSLADYWYKLKDFGVRLDAMLQVSLQNGTLKAVVKERICYLYPVDDATVYVLKKEQ